MKMAADFRCNGEVTEEEIPERVLGSIGASYRTCHSESIFMAKAARSMKLYNGDSLCKLPFCVTMEADAFGAEVIVSEKSSSPRFNGYMFQKLEELKELKQIDLANGRIRELLCSVQLLQKKGETVSLEVQGPFTVLALLIDVMELYRGVRKNRRLVENALEVISEGLFCFIQEGISMGAQIISYAEPTGTPEQVGLEMYREFYSKPSFSLLKKIKGELPNVLIHLCGKTSIAYERSGLCRVSPLIVPVGLTYGEALKMLSMSNEAIIAGHKCMKSTSGIMTSNVVWQIDLLC